MKVVLQRILSSQLSANGNYVSETGRGLLIFVGIFSYDTEKDAETIASKILNLRIFSDLNGKMGLSLIDTGFEAMVIPNFTLCADTSRGRRPSFETSMEPLQAKQLFEKACEFMRNKLLEKIKTGVFGSDMEIKSINDGPVTIILDTRDNLNRNGERQNGNRKI